MSPGVAQQLGALWRAQRYGIAPLVQTLLLSRDFHASAGTRIKSPVEQVISTYRKLGVAQVPGIPDFNASTGALGQRPLHPPAVAGRAHGRS